MADFLNLDAPAAVVDAELIKAEFQVRLKRERFQNRVQELKIFIDDRQLWVEEEQLRLDGAEIYLRDTLSRDERRVDDVEIHLINALARVERDQRLVDNVEAYLEDAQSQLEEVQRRFEQDCSY